MTKEELNEIKKSSVKKDPATCETSTAYNPAQSQHQFSQNSKKQQQYNNYQRQQQQEFNMPFGKYQQNYHQNGKPQTLKKNQIIVESNSSIYNLYIYSRCHLCQLCFQQWKPKIH